jgi:hypothetical protein
MSIVHALSVGNDNNKHLRHERKEKKLIKCPEGLGFQQKVLYIRLSDPLKVIFNRMTLSHSM